MCDRSDTLLMPAEIGPRDTQMIGRCLDTNTDPRKALAAMDQLFTKVLRRATGT